MASQEPHDPTRAFPIDAHREPVHASDGKVTGHKCRYCKRGFALSSGPTGMRRHLPICRHVPAAVLRSMDKHAVARAKARLGQYVGEAYKRFEVTGFDKAKCIACGTAVDGQVDKLNAHLSSCLGGKHKPTTSRNIGFRRHFKVVVDRHGKKKGSECRFCHTMLGPATNHVRIHLASCPKVPERILREMDEQAVQHAKQGLGAYGTNPMYRHFEVTGYRVARCRVCSTVVRGDTGKLGVHWTRLCPRVPRLWTSPDCTEHFVPCRYEGTKVVAKACRFCGSELVTFLNPHLRNHLGRCGRAPADIKETLDAWARRRAAAKAGAYGRNPVYEQFEVVGWLRARCKACRLYVHGNATALRLHNGECRAGSGRARPAKRATRTKRPRAAADARDTSDGSDVSLSSDSSAGSDAEEGEVAVPALAPSEQRTRRAARAASRARRTGALEAGAQAGSGAVACTVSCVVPNTAPAAAAGGTPSAAAAPRATKRRRVGAAAGTSGDGRGTVRPSASGGSSRASEPLVAASHPRTAVAHTSPVSMAMVMGPGLAPASGTPSSRSVARATGARAVYEL